MKRSRRPTPLSQRGPLRVMFVITSMPVGGAETLLLNLIRSLDPERMTASVICLKDPGALGQQLALHTPLYHNVIRHKVDIGVVGRIGRIIQEHRADAVITVGAGDKMFWGRVAARRMRTPVILSALHSTGWPDNVGRINRLLTGITDGFIAVAEPHRDYLIANEGFPAAKVHIVPNGIDTQLFQLDPQRRADWRKRLGIPQASPVCGIVAALRPEKNHRLFLDVASTVGQRLPQSHFVIAGDGVLKQDLMSYSRSLACPSRIHFLGNVDDVAGLLSAFDMFTLTSDNEASPVSILEAMSCQLPVVAPRVGSIDRAVINGTTGRLVAAGDVVGFIQAWTDLLDNSAMARSWGEAGRAHVVRYGSLDQMATGYMDLIEKIYASKYAGKVEGPAGGKESLSIPCGTSDGPTDSAAHASG